MEIDSKLPLVEVITLGGFFFICIMEEFLHHFLAPHEPTADCDTFMDTHQEKREEGMWRSWGNTNNNNGVNLVEFKRYDRRSREDSDSPPSYRADKSITDSRSYDNRGHRGTNMQISTVSGCKLKT